MKFKAEGLVEFSDGMELTPTILKDPFMIIKFVNYDMETNKFSLVCDFYEVHNKIRRKFDNPKTIIGLVKTEDVLEFTQTDEFLSQFVLVG